MKAEIAQYVRLEISTQFGDTINADNSTFSVFKTDGITPKDLSGHTSTLIISKDGAEAMRFESSAGEIILQNGSFYLKKSATDMKTLPIGNYTFDQNIILGTDETTLIKGTWKVAA